MSVDIKESPEAKARTPIYQTESKVRLKTRMLLEKWARWVITSGGLAVIASIVAILVYIAIEIWPLFQPAEVNFATSLSVKDMAASADDQDVDAIAAGVDDNQEVGYIVFENGVVQFFSILEGTARERFSIEELQDATITSVWQSLDGRELILGTSQGQTFKVAVDYNSEFFEGDRSYEPEISVNAGITVDSTRGALTKLTFAGDSDESMAIAAITEDRKVLVFLQEKEESFLGETEIVSAQYEIPPKWTGQPQSLAIDASIKNLYIGTNDGKIYHWNVSIEDEPEFVSVARVSKEGEVGVTALDFLIGSRTLMVGESDGGVSAWFLVRDSTAVTGWRLTRIRDMAPNPAAVTVFAPSARGKGFISGDNEGNLLLQYSTSNRKLAEFGSDEPSPVEFVNFAPKANAALALNAEGNLSHWKIDNPHPEASFKAFFGKVWYEGYPEPEYVWQSTGGSDDFEPKLSLVPLIFGSLKGTVYALIIAIPLAILGAIFTSQFMHPSWRNYVKPTVEIMAALPSVILGFLAGLWLAPIIEDIVPAVLLMGIFIPMLILICSIIWRQIPQRFRNRFRMGVESLLLVPIIVLGIYVCLELNTTLEQWLFGGNFQVWLFDSVNLPYDQRNALVVGIAMGFAVIPIIYTISEDALSNVPKALVSGSLALGATRWQTAIRVVFPTAAAGIFSAIMIGFGRAVGETMIVLMATGNTPIMDWNIFNGFRTLSANIAVEIPEAPVGGTLFRVLFLSAFLLFIITFLVNTLAELVRQKLRERYQKL